MTYDPSWDRPHVIGEDESWQESDCYWWFDAAAGIGGWHRVGQYPNQARGQSSVFLYRIGGQRFLDRSIEVPGDQCSRNDAGQVVGNSSVENVEPQVMRYTYDADDASFDLAFHESFYAPRDWVSAAGHDRALATEAGHLECAGRIRGTVRIGSETHQVNALAHRDRSWGNRSLYGLDVLWFCNGTIGPELSWACMDVRLSGGPKRTVGFIARGQETQDLSEVEINTVMAKDGVTPLRAFMTLKTPDDSIDLDIRTNQGFVQRIAPGPFIVVDQSSRVTAEGGVGFADFGVVQNAFQGEHLPTPDELTLTAATGGLAQFSDHNAALSQQAKQILER